MQKLRALLLMGLVGSSPAAALIHGNPFGQTITANDTAYQAGSYTFFQHANGNAAGKTYTQQVAFAPALFPAFQNLSWNWPSDTALSQIKTFNGPQFGDYNSTTPPLPVTPSKVSQIVSLTETLDTNIGGATTGHDVIDDMFLTDTAWNTTAAHHLFEVEVAHHTPAFFKTYADSVTSVGTFTDARGVAWKVSIDPNANSGATPDILFYPTGLQDELVGTYDLKAMLLYLVGQGRLTGNEYYNGHAFGAEVQQGAAYLSIRNFAVTYAPPASTNLLGVSNLADPSWTKTNATIANGGTASQALMETSATGVHSAKLTIRKPAVATNYRLEYDVTQSATSGLGRDFILGQVGNVDFSGATYQGVKTSTTQGIFNSYGYGGFSINGTNSVGAPVSGVEHVTLDFQSDAQQQMIIVLNPESAQATDSYAGSTSSGVRITGVYLSTR